MNNWLSQVTTGHGAMILGPTLLAVASGTMSWQTALPLILAGVVGLLWPENPTLKTATQSTATDVEALVQAYLAGHVHGAASAAVTNEPPAPKAAA